MQRKFIFRERVEILLKSLRGYYPASFIFMIIISLSYGGVSAVYSKVLTRKAQTKGGNIVTITLGDDSYSGPLHGTQTFQVFIDPPLGDTLRAFRSVSLRFLRKPKRGGGWVPLRGFEVIFKGNLGTVKHLLNQGTVSTIVRQNSIEFQGEVFADIAGMWKMEVMLIPKDTGKKEQVSSHRFIVR
jgi:hypothetical protein